MEIIQETNTGRTDDMLSAKRKIIHAQYERLAQTDQEKAALFSEFFAAVPHADKFPHFSMFTELVFCLVSMPNHPGDRSCAQQKAEFLKDILTVDGLTVEITTHEDGSRGNLYNILAHATPTTHADENTPHGLIVVHHDTIKQDSVVAKLEGDRLTHPWLLDDTLHVAAAVCEMIRFANDPHRCGEATLIITDREETNTLGMMKYLEEQAKNDTVRHFSWIIDGESTGKPDHEISVAVANRGKGVREVRADISQNPISVAVAAQDIIARIRIAQGRAFSESSEGSSDLPDNVRLSPTAIVPTVVTVDREGIYAYLECRTDDYVGPTASDKILRASFSGPLWTNGHGIDPDQTPFDPSHMTLAIEPSGENTMLIECGTNQHPGKYDPRTRTDAFSAIEYLLTSLPPEVKADIVGITIGDPMKPNSMSHSATIQLRDQADCQKFIASCSDIHEEVTDAVPRDIQYEQSRPPDIPDRGTLRIDEDSVLVQTARYKLAANMSAATGETCALPPVGVFNAMLDAGALTVDPETLGLISSEIQNVITLGAGDFHMLHHPQEPLTHRTVLWGLCQYYGMIDALNRASAG